MKALTYFCQAIRVLALPPGLLARYLRLTDLMLEFGPNLGMPHTRSMGDRLFELRVKSKEGIARVFYCTLVGEKIVMLHSFVKKTQKTPKQELQIARRRLKEVLKHDP
ncbi:type II toxin-antitoxin system RelE/ParE family toxin [Acaryochloris sp. 'Moss Beach']|uniref:type II toxin-antitoxin system RelE/ParE family toxin n=1 Tax=Acaryochloris sp. 'Moss Beach' TaxID=2740837 RepID=UPI0028F40FE5|nr:type II toxin-antitoxin system RelE/ParE family toxin [Acaryochloris sp. 'Moss Beach']UJB71829.1 type II toxin-antitoxin system RelE/ParE family toxin [Acaryochloris sp. 'Moss Beach']